MDFSQYFPFWSSLTAQQQQLLAQSSQQKTYAAGQMLHDGSECTGLILVLSGQIRVFTISEEGKELTLYRLMAGQMCLLSASCMLQGITFSIMTSAQQDSEVLLIPASVYQQLMQSSAEVANYTNALMASHFSEVMWLMDQILNKKLDSRLAAFLLEERQLSGSDRLPLTHEQIANHLGSVREVITRMLKYFQNESLVQLTRGNVTITNPAGLEELARSSMRNQT